MMSISFKIVLTISAALILAGAPIAIITDNFNWFGLVVIGIFLVSVSGIWFL